MNRAKKSDDGASFELNRIQIFQEDVLAGLSIIPDKSIDLVVADPPYGAFSLTPSQLPAGHGLEGAGGAWKAANHEWDKINPKDHLEIAMSWLSEVKRVTSESGSIWIHSSYHNSGFVNVACQLLGLEIINEVVWFKRNAFPNLKGTRLTASHETILWVHTGGPKKRNYRFNYDLIKSFEYPEDSLKSAGKQMRTVWDISNNKSKDEISLGKHPTQKPERVIQRLLDIAGFAGGTLLSPFAGSGTDLVVAMRNGMNGIGFELEAEYFDLACRRIAREASELSGRLTFEVTNDN